ncbi:hypothetical protein YC2023_076522 [Brassica napus]
MLEIYSIPTLDMSCSQLTARGKIVTQQFLLLRCSNTHVLRQSCVCRYDQTNQLTNRCAKVLLETYNQRGSSNSSRERSQKRVIIPQGYIGVIQTAKRCFRFKNPISSEKPRNIQRKFRGNPFLPRNSVGIFRGNSGELVFGVSIRLFFLKTDRSMDICTKTHRSIEYIRCSSEFPRNIPRLFLGNRVWGNNVIDREQNLVRFFINGSIDVYISKNASIDH